MTADSASEPRWKKYYNQRAAEHGKAGVTYSIFYREDGSQCFQINTHEPSKGLGGGKSQSIRFGPEGIRELKSLLDAL